METTKKRGNTKGGPHEEVAMRASGIEVTRPEACEVVGKGIEVSRPEPATVGLEMEVEADSSLSSVSGKSSVCAAARGLKPGVCSGPKSSKLAERQKSSDNGGKEAATRVAMVRESEAKKARPAAVKAKVAAAKKVAANGTATSSEEGEVILVITPAPPTSGEGSLCESIGVSATSQEKRGRGRPPTTGEYVGRAKVAKAYNDELERGLKLQAERELREEMASIDKRCREETAGILSAGHSEEDQTSLSLQRAAQAHLEKVLTVAQKSGNLKGIYQKALKDSAAGMSSIVDKLIGRTSSSEVEVLRAANRRLEGEMGDLRQQVEELKKRISSS